MPSWKDEAEADVPTKSWRDEAVVEDTTAKPVKPGYGESAISAAAQGLTGGHSDEWGAALNAGMDKVIGQGIYGVPVDYDEEYKKYRGQMRDHIDTNRKTNPKVFGTVEVGAPIVAAIGSGGASAIAKAPGLFGAGNLARGLGAAAFNGAAAGEGYSDADLGTKENAIDTAIGGGLGVGSYGLAKGAGKIASGVDDALGLSQKASAMKGEVSDWLTKKANSLYTNAVTGNSKKVTSNIDKSFPGGIQGYGRAAREGGLVKFGDTTEKVGERAAAKLQEAKDLLNTTYSKADELGANVDPMKIRDRLLSLAADNDLTGDQDVVNRLLEQAGYFERLGAKKGGLPLTDVLTRKTSIKYKPSDDPQVSNQIKKAIGTEMTDAAEKFSASPGAENIADDLKEGNRLYSVAKPAVTASEDFARSEAARNTFSPHDKATGLTYFLSKAGKAALSPIETVADIGKAVGTAALNKQGRTRFSSSAAVTADKIAEALKSSPEAFGPYTNVLRSALEKGERKLGVAHEILMKHDPKYAEFIQRNFGQ